MLPIEYTHCQDYEPHEEHLLEILEDKKIYCIGESSHDS